MQTSLENVGNEDRVLMRRTWSEKDFVDYEHRKYTDAIRKAGIMMLESIVEPKGKATIFLHMDSSGIGKSLGIEDAARRIGLRHLRVDVSLFDSVTAVATKCTEFFPVNQPRMWMARRDVIARYVELFNKSIAEVFDCCREAVKDLPAGSSREVSANERSSTDATSAWRSLLRSIDGGEGVVIHFDECQDIFPHDQRPENGDLLGSLTNKWADGFTVDRAPRLALRAFMLALKPYIKSKAVVFAFTGLRPNLRPVLNIPTDWNYVDMSDTWEYFDAATMYEMLCKYANFPGNTTPFAEADEQMKRCMTRLRGPPRLLDCLFFTLSNLGIRDITHMYSAWNSIETEMEVVLKNRFLPGLENTPSGIAEFCLLAPYLERSGILKFSIDNRMNVWSDLVESGLLRIRTKHRNETRGSDTRSCSRMDLIDVNSEVSFELPYLLLRKVLCTKSGVPAFIVDALARLVNCKGFGIDLVGKTFEYSFLLSIATPRTRAMQKWVRSSLHLAGDIPPGNDVCTSKRMNFAHGEPIVVSYDPPNSNEKSGIDILFESTLDNKSSATPEPERVYVTAQVTVTEDYTTNIVKVVNGTPVRNARLSTADKVVFQHEDKRIYDLLRMARHAEDVYEKTTAAGCPRRTIIIFGAPNLKALSRVELNELGARLPATDSLGRKYAKFAINTPLQKEAGITIKRTFYPYRPYAIFYASLENPIWKEMCVSVDAIRRHDEAEMKQGLLRYFIPGASFEADTDFVIGTKLLDVMSRTEWVRVPEQSHVYSQFGPISPRKRTGPDMQEILADLEELGMSTEGLHAFKKRYSDKWGERPSLLVGCEVESSE